MNSLKKNSSEGSISVDNIKNTQEEIQKITDSYVNNINEICKKKENDIMQI